jgi:hypothetical protein
VQTSPFTRNLQMKKERAFILEELNLSLDPDNLVLNCHSFFKFHFSGAQCTPPNT